MSELEDVQTTVAVIDGLRARIAELEADLADLHSSFMADASIHKAEVAELEAERDLAKFNEQEYMARLKRADEDNVRGREAAGAALAIGSEWMTRAEQAEAALAEQRAGAVSHETLIATECERDKAEVAALDAIHIGGMVAEELKVAMAALAERDTRRCEMCGHWGKHEMWPDQGWCPQHNEMDADCSCSEWTTRAEEGSE